MNQWWKLDDSQVKGKLEELARQGLNPKVLMHYWVMVHEEGRYLDPALEGVAE